MTRPDDIPAEVWEVARAIARVLWLNPTERKALALGIARALMARDERAARIIEQEAEKYEAASVETLSVSEKLRLDACATLLRSFASAIRNPSEGEGRE